MIYDTAVIVKNGPELSPATNAIIPGVWKSIIITLTIEITTAIAFL